VPKNAKLLIPIVFAAEQLSRNAKFDSLAVTKCQLESLYLSQLPIIISVVVLGPMCDY